MSGTVSTVPMTIVDGDLPSKLAQALRASERIAVDTETTGLDWATDRLQLCQLFTPTTGVVLLRRVGRQPPREFQSLLADPNILKIFHHAPFDLKFLESQWSVQVTNIACTKTASKLLSPDVPQTMHSLQSLVRRFLEVEITKGPVRTSDWGSEHLTEEQLSYAAGDVVHLLDLHSLLLDRLEDAGLHDLFKRVCAYIPIDSHLAVAGFPNPLTY